MTDDTTTLDDYFDLSYRILCVLEEFVDEIGCRGCTVHFDSVLTGGKYLKGKKVGQLPERFIEDHLIFPLLREFGHSLRPQPVRYAPKWPGSGRPDFSLTTISTDTAKENGLRLFGESKTPNKLHYAREDVIEYLDGDLDFHALAVLTDGIEWELWVRPLHGDPSLYACADLKPVFRDVKARNLENESYRQRAVCEKVDENSFAAFTAPAVVETVRREFGLDPPINIS